MDYTIVKKEQRRSLGTMWNDFHYILLLKKAKCKRINIYTLCKKERKKGNMDICTWLPIRLTGMEDTSLSIPSMILTFGIMSMSTCSKNKS